MAKFGNLVEVPPTNIHVDVPGSMIHIEKATLKPEAFRDLHLPVTFSGGSQFRGSFMYIDSFSIFVREPLNWA